MLRPVEQRVCVCADAGVGRAPVEVVLQQWAVGSITGTRLVLEPLPCSDTTIGGAVRTSAVFRSQISWTRAAVS